MSFDRSIVFMDANVWFSRTLRDWIAMLYVTPASPPYDVRWSEDVLAEVLHSLRRQHAEWPGERITGIRDKLASTFENGRVEVYPMDPSYPGNDPFDAHVHAAAVACGAHYLVTFNVTDFPDPEGLLPYEVLTPDEFLTLVGESAPELVGEVALAMCTYWLKKNGEASLPQRLKKAGCPTFAERVRATLLGQEAAISACQITPGDHHEDDRQVLSDQLID